MNLRQWVVPLIEPLAVAIVMEIENV